jgi:hypothetical protein
MENMAILQFQTEGRHSAMGLQTKSKDNVWLSPESSHTQTYFINSGTLNQSTFIYNQKK